jgi:hypothetical protein
VHNFSAVLLAFRAILCAFTFGHHFCQYFAAQLLQMYLVLILPDFNVF